MNKRKRLLAILINGMLLSSICVASAADVTVGAGNGVAYGTGSTAPKAENVAIGKDAKIEYSGGVGQPSTGDIVIGGSAHTNNYIDQGGGIAIGANSFVENMSGGLERAFDFKQAGYNSFWGIPYGLPQDPTKMVTGVAIGQNTYARSGSVMLGTHNYKGKLGDVDVDSAHTKDNNGHLFSTTVGANSYSNGLFSSVVGSYSIASSKYSASAGNETKNFGSTITGALNSIESASSSSKFAGVANSIVGVANRTNNSNGSLIFGAGNEITNSIASISGAPTSGGDNPNELRGAVKNAVKDANGGGATMAFGGGNKADYTLRTSMIGINNTVTGANGAESADNLVMGVGNTAANVQHLTAIGSKNTISDAKNTVIVGDNRKVTSANNSVIIGSSDAETTTTVNDAVAIGHNTEVSAEGGVALGSKSKATVAAGAAGYDISTKAASTDTSSTWKATASAVSVGDVANDVTRQITSVAAGTNDTDAVNVAQLKKVATKITAVEANVNKHATVVAGDNTTVTTGANANGGIEYKVAVKKDLVDMNSANFGNVTDTIHSRIDKDSARFFNGSENIGITPQGVKIENTDTLEQASFTKSGMYASEGNTTVYYTTNGISAGDQIINNVKAGVADTDAVNVSQLKRVQDQITNSTTNISQNTADIKNIKGDISKLDKRVNKAVAGSAALAALHPLDFDPDAKWDFAAGYGHYHNGNAAALGAFYRPNEDVQLSVGSTVGNGETVVNAGLSVKVGAHSNVSRSRVAIGKEVLELKKTVALQNAQIQKLTTLLNGVAGTNMKADRTTLFPDVPSNHWAYEAVSNLSRRGLVEGYPDGTFGGDRLLTRYEFAEIVYRAIQNGVQVNEQLVTEFSPEMALFRVDTVAKNHQGEPTIERVRVNKK